jgi:hypothetical protein
VTRMEEVFWKSPHSMTSTCKTFLMPAFCLGGGHRLEMRVVGEVPFEMSLLYNTYQ